ncbi:MAG: AAA family ATPase [Muribaculaceae bacterium]|nr:AAA family ATPase [Muribaculaceae bacterium]
MKLDNIAFYNYRCFADFKIEFAPEVNVLIGKNGAGKTSAVKGIVKALRDCFPRLQFIMTTHSPLVISNLPTQSGANRLISMPTNHSEPIYLI